MRVLRCAGPGCPIVAEWLRLAVEDDMLAGRCLCREGLARCRDGGRRREEIAGEPERVGLGGTGDVAGVGSSGPTGSGRRRVGGA